MEKTRFAIICDLHRLAHGIRNSLALAEHLADSAAGDPARCKELCKDIKREMKFVPMLLNDIREYIAGHSDKELAQQFAGLHGYTKRLYDLCSAHSSELRKETFYMGNAVASMEIIGEYFLAVGSGGKEADKAEQTMTRAEATDCIDTIRTLIRGCMATAGTNKGIDEAGKKAHALFVDMGKEKIEAVKEYVTNANDKDLAGLFTESQPEALQLSMLFQKGDTRAQLAGIRMFHIALAMGYLKRNVLYERVPKTTAICTEDTSSAFAQAESAQAGTFTTTAQVPVLRLYQFLTTFAVQSGPEKGKPVLDGNAVSDKEFIRAVMRADYSTAYRSCVRGKMRCVITLLSKAYFKDWKAYRATAARSVGLTPESLAKYNVEKPFISRLKELLPMIK